MNEGLQEKVIVVTGASGTLGAAVVPMLIKAGAIVEGVFRKPGEEERLLGLLSEDERKRIRLHQLDQLDRMAVDNFVNDVIAQHHRIDGLANLTGGWDTVPFADMTWEQWQAQLNINLHTCWIMTRAVVPQMLKQQYGRIVSIGARAAMQATAKVSHYVVSKVGVAWLMESIANEYRGTGVTANTVLPSSIKSAQNPTGVPAEEIAPAILYLLSSESSASSGAKIPVYGKG